MVAYFLMVFLLIIFLTAANLGPLLFALPILNSELPAGVGGGGDDSSSPSGGSDSNPAAAEMTQAPPVAEAIGTQRQRSESGGGRADSNPAASREK
jgi:hypothetical protein